jgi:hypothetical protein
VRAQRKWRKQRSRKNPGEAVPLEQGMKDFESNKETKFRNESESREVAKLSKKSQMMSFDLGFYGLGEL